MQNEGNRALPINDYILDSYALLAYFEAEEGSDRVKELLIAAKARKCELMYIVERERGLSAAQDTLIRIEELPIHIINADRTVTLAAAHLKMDCPIAYADCFAAALAQLRNAALVTGDPEFGKIKAERKIHIEWLAKQKE
jgi:ribonuclease VapC